MSVLRKVEPLIASRPAHPDVMFFCPGCQCAHGVWTSKAAHNGARWTWNGDVERPTFSPSLVVTLEYPQGHGVPPKTVRCHSYVTNGQIQFLSDSTHALAGQTVPLQPF